MDVDLEELAAIIEQLDKTEFTDFSFEKGDLRIRVLRGGHLGTDAGTTSAVRATTAPTASGGTAAPAGTTTQAGAAPAGGSSGQVGEAPAGGSSGQVGAAARAANGQAADGVTVVRAPMLGHFYRAPKPGEKPFVEVGDVVEADSVLCIIEVMKLMNSVPAGVGGEVVEVLVEDGALVEFDQPIFAVRRPE